MTHNANHDQTGQSGTALSASIVPLGIGGSQASGLISLPYPEAWVLESLGHFQSLMRHALNNLQA